MFIININCKFIVYYSNTFRSKFIYRRTNGTKAIPLIVKISGSSGKWSDNVSIEQKKTAEHFVYLNNHKQIYKNEQQFSISCMGALQS